MPTSSTGCYESLPSWQGVKDGAQTLAQGAADKASQIYDDPAGQARQGAQATKDYLSGLWGSTKNIYSASGAPGVAGAALGVIGDVVSPSKKLRMVKEGVEVVHDLEKAKKLEQAVGKAAKSRKTEAAVKEGEDGLRVTRIMKKLRLKYLGRTPGKKSRTGREVIKRMEKEGKIRTNAETGVIEFRAGDGEWYDLSRADMAHKTDAVKWWNEEGRKYGARAPEVRAWMLNPENYYLELNSINRAQGAALSRTHNYLPPLR